MPVPLPSAPLSPAPDVAVQVEGLTHRYGERTALEAVHLQVAAGALFGLLGPNGGGKTTLFRILSTLLRPTDGRARVFGLDTSAQAAAVRRRLGVVFQQPALDADLTVRENLRFHGALYGLHGAALDARIGRVLDALDVADRATDRVRALSGGLARRVDLARGLLHAPGLLLLDEPTTGLDPAARHAFWQVLDRVRRTEGTTLLVATHLLEEADACDAIALLDAGRLVAEGTPEGLKRELGGETLWLETDDPVALAGILRDRLDLETQVAGRRVRVAHPDAHALLGGLYDAAPDLIRSATVRRPTLEDVFMAHTGSRIDEPEPALS